LRGLIGKPIGNLARGRQSANLSRPINLSRRGQATTTACGYGNDK
jgi:hypothetical protein